MLQLAAKERVLLDLLDYVRYADSVEVPPAMAQEGIAEASWFDLPHFSEYVRPLLRNGLLRERMAHVKGVRQRRKVYDLTETGRLAAIRLRDSLKGETVRVRDAGGEREATISQVVQELAGKASILRILREHAAAGVVDLTIVTETKPPQFVETLADAPKVDHFVGRRTELGTITAEDPGPQIFVVRGVAGIGKSTLAAKACDLLRGTRNLYWHDVRPWDSRVSLLVGVGEFLAALGKPGLRAILQRGSVERASEVLREDLGGTRSLLVFDDVHEASPEALPFFRLLTEAVVEVPDARVLVLTRERLSFYNRRDVVLKGLVVEFDLAGLTPEEAAAHLAADPQSVAAIPQSGGFLGLPLFLELVRAHGTVPSAAVRDVRRFLEEEVYAELSDPERRTMKVAALYRVPVPEAALFADPDSGPDVRLSLVNRSLVRPVGEDRYEVHDTIRDLFTELASPAERQRFGSFAAEQLRRLASEASENRKFSACAGYLSNALRFAESAADRTVLWEALGEADRHQGDLSAALIAYREAAKAASGPEARARMYRRAAHALLDRGELTLGSAEVEEGFQALGDVGGPERGWLELARSRALDKGGDEEGAWTHGQKALEIFEGAADHEGLARAHFKLADLGRSGIRQDRVGVVEHHMQAAAEHADPKTDPFLLVEIHRPLVHLLAVKGDFDGAGRHIAAIESIPGALEDDTTRRGFLWSRGEMQVWRGDLSAAKEDFVELLRLSKGVRDDEGASDAKYWLSIVAGEEGKWSEARALMVEAAGDRMKLGHLTHNLLYWASVYSLIEGNLEEFRRLLAASKQAKPRTPVGSHVYVDLLEALDCLIRGDGERSLAILAEPLRAVEALPRESWTTPLLASKVYICFLVVLRTLGQDAEAEDYRRRLAAMAPGPLVLAHWERFVRRITEGIQRLAESLHSR